ncbi:862_t:CDS:1, partial [Gigaspora rosea]
KSKNRLEINSYIYKTCEYAIDFLIYPTIIETRDLDCESPTAFGI